MSILSNAEFSVLNINLAKEMADSKKIKFKHESYLRICKKYDSFCAESTPNISKTVSTMPPVENKQQIGEQNVVIHIKNRTYEKRASKQEKLKDQIYILEVVGTLLPQFAGRRALKIKDSMKNNMLENNKKACEKEVEKVELPINPEPSLPVEKLDDIEQIKISKNGASSAKISKYTDESSSIEDIQDAQKAKPISELLGEIKEQKDKFKFNVPQIKIATPQTFAETSKSSTDSNELKEVISMASEPNRNSKVEVGHLRDSLAKANQLKEELELAKKNAEKAKAEAQLAKEKAAAEKKEAEIVQEQLVETIKKLEEHNRKLEEEKKLNEKEAEKYTAESQEYTEREKEYSTMQEEYKQTINEMLAIIG